MGNADRAAVCIDLFRRWFGKTIGPPNRMSPSDLSEGVASSEQRRLAANDSSRAATPRRESQRLRIA